MAEGCFFFFKAADVLSQTHYISWRRSWIFLK